jgi:membrane protease subunit (stomatin/prohibitin family)
MNNDEKSFNNMVIEFINQVRRLTIPSLFHYLRYCFAIKWSNKAKIFFLAENKTNFIKFHHGLNNIVFNREVVQ